MRAEDERGGAVHTFRRPEAFMQLCDIKLRCVREGSLGRCSFCCTAGRDSGGGGILDSKSIEWVRALQAISQTGLHYADDAYDVRRYQEVRKIAAEMLAASSNLSTEQALSFAAAEFGYATPKVDVRGVAFHDSQILLVREIQDQGRWTVPGGWADANETPSQAVVREVFEESGFEVNAVKLLAVYDREKQGHVPPFPFHVYKLFFLCKIIGGAPRPNEEASEIGFFAEDKLPDLSVSRVTEAEIKTFFRYLRNPSGETEFD